MLIPAPQQPPTRPGCRFAESPFTPFGHAAALPPDQDRVSARRAAAGYELTVRRWLHELARH